MQTHKRYLALVMVALLLGMAAAPGGRPASATQRVPAASRCFPESGFCLDAPFLGFWERNGGLAVFGYPIVELSQRELNRDTGGFYSTQWLERYRMESHPENQAPYDIQLGRLGEQRLLQLGIDWRQLPPAAGPQDGCLWFAETRHNICDQAAGLGFKTYWQGHGLEFDGAVGTSQSESLALFGLPLTEPRLETNASGDTVLTQWFERARFEWHPDKPAEYKVLLGLLASELLNDQPLPGLEGRIAYRQTTERGANLLMTTANGARQILLASDLGNSPQVVSPDGRSIALWHHKADSRSDLYVIDIASGRRTLVAPDRSGPWSLPTWSPDNQKIVFDDLYTLFMVNVNGTQVQPLMQGYPVISADWSPNGQEVAFTSWQSFSSGTTDVGIVRADGSTIAIIRRNARFIGWSPDGTRFLFQQSQAYNPTQSDPNLYVINKDGSGERKLSDYSDLSLLNAHWRNDSEIAIVVSTDSTSTACEVLKANVDSGLHETLASTVACWDGLGWSPNAHFLAFSRHGLLEVMDLDTKRFVPLDIDGHTPTWAPR
jgi:hypothetical protein